jgi:hypothetical protein
VSLIKHLDQPRINKQSAIAEELWAMIYPAEVDEGGDVQMDDVPEMDDREWDDLKPDLNRDPFKLVNRAAPYP